MSLHPEDVPPRLEIVRFFKAQHSWKVFMLPGTTEFTFPDYPAPADAEAVFGLPSGPLPVGRVVHCELAPEGDICLRQTTHNPGFDVDVF